MAFPNGITAGYVYSITNNSWRWNGYAWDSYDGLPKWGSFWDTTQQGITSTTIAYPIKFNNYDTLNSGVSLVDNTKITFTYSGIYNLQFSAQVANSENNQVNEATFWLKKNGTDIPDTAGVVSIEGKHSGVTGYALPSWNWIIGITANDYVELYWHTNSTNVYLHTFETMTEPIHPLSPSVIFTAQQLLLTQFGPTGATGATGTMPTDYVISVNGQTGAVVISGGGGEITGDYVISINGSTGAITNVARINEGNTFSVRQVMNAGITTANLQVSGGATFSTIYASSTTNTIDAIASTDGIGLRVARSIGGGPSSIGGILLGRSSVSQYNYLLYTSTGTFYVINGTGPAASQLMALNALDANFNVPIRGATFSSSAGRITVQKSSYLGSDSGTVRIVGADALATQYNSDIRANADAAADTTHTLPSTSGTLLNTASSYVISVNGQTGAVTISGGTGATGATGTTGPTEDNITLFIDANPDDITTGNKGYKQIAYDCQPIEWYVLAGQTGSIEFDIKKSSFASYPSTTSIVGTDNPELISQMKNSNTGITAWSGLSAGDIIDFVINSNTGIKSVGLFIKIRRTT